MTEFRSAAELAGEVREFLDSKFAETDFRLFDIEQKLARDPGPSGGGSRPSLGAISSSGPKTSKPSLAT